LSQVAVILPCYNHAHYLPQALASVLAETRPADDIVVVDDGSTDDTAAVAADFAPRVRYVHRPNGGLSAARNTGIAATSAELLAFLDADDLWTPDFLATLVPVLQRSPQLGAVHGGAGFIDAEGQPLAQQATRVEPPDRVHDALIDGDYFPAHAVLVRRTAFDTVGTFDESLNASEDWDMWLRISARFAFGGVPDIVALYRMHGDNMSKDLGRMHASQLAVVRKNFGPEDGEPDTWPVDRRRAYAGIYFWRAMAQNRHGRPAEGRGDLRHAAELWPALVTRLDTWYGLGCAAQAMGQLGDVAALDLEDASRRVTEALAQTFAPPMPPDLAAIAPEAHAVAYQALGRLAWSQGRTDAARHWLARAARSQPKILAERAWLADSVRALAGRRLVAAFKGWHAAG
jgi:glycosyltransferase involved in cell wall biosynthesis